MKKFFAGFTSSLFSNKVLAANTINLMVSIYTFEVDPLIWAICAAGATVVFAHSNPGSKAKTIANGIISVFCGVILAPYLNDIFITRFPSFSNPQYLLVGLLSGGWPWIFPILEKIIINRFTIGFNK